MSSLIDLTEKWHEIELSLMKNGGELTPELEKAFTIIEGELTSKTDAYHFYLAKIKSTETFFKEEAAKYTEEKRKFTRAHERIKSLVIKAMNTMQTEKLEGNKADFKLSYSPGSVEITDEKLLPDEFVEVTRRPMKAEILKVLKAGGKVPGATLVRSQQLKTLKKRG